MEKTTTYYQVNNVIDSISDSAFILHAAFTLGLSEIRQKTQRCPKNAYDGLENVYYLWTEMWLKCMRIVENICCFASKFEIIGDFRVAFCLCFKASPSVKPFIWKFVLFTCKFWFIYMWIKLISIRKGFALGLTLKQRRKATQKSPISLAFKWLIILRCTIKCIESLEMCLLCPKKH